MKIFPLETSRNRASVSIFGAYSAITDKFYWKSAAKSDKKEFKSFLNQLKTRCNGKKCIIILDNASIHTCKYIKEYVQKQPTIELYYLPTYSPEYNPIERLWRWLKIRVNGQVAAINGGIKEIVKRIGTIINAWRFGKLINPPQIGLGIWKELLVEYL